jgi:hypothetical protein
MAMSRLGFFFASRFGCDQFSPFCVDERKLHSALQKKGALVNLSAPNPASHLELREISILFGGHEVRVVGEQPIHQMLHTDAASPATFGRGWDKKIVPSSFVIPLQSERKIYVRTPEDIITVNSNRMLVYHGDLPYITRRARYRESWEVAIQGHIDSRYHNRILQKVPLGHVDKKGYHPLPHISQFGTWSMSLYSLRKLREVEMLLQILNNENWLHEIQKRALAEDSDNEKEAAVEVLRLIESINYSGIFRSFLESCKKSECYDGKRKREE